ncbi:uncharacterized protein LOC113399565 [Vanessa tameamea]|uniref:Uncharacterized protein LOC113399565 n=1 Tax=Vanessa tameamea TaxID=334116 RepID=A0A8B8IBP1_VANTA|nr:uncharacterized protein LOC113399565 [Vanessa tameamea]
MQLVTKVHLYRSPYTICYISEDRLTLPDEYSYKSIGVKNDTNDSNIGDQNVNILDLNKKNLKFSTSALFLQPFLKECLNSNVYRINVLRNLNELSGHPNSGTLFLKLILEPPDREVIDYAWNERMLQLIWTRVEVENAFSWLSTLGGAYSALGDYFEHCAEEAGKISMRQYALSKMLGDDGLAARSRLYSAIAFAQKGKLKVARYLVRNIAAFARETHDKRLNRMCQGVWVKLRYLREKQCIEKSNSVKTENINSE